MKRSTLATLVLALAPVAAPAQDAGHYADVSAYPLSDARFETWIHLRIHLARNFDEICGDTFCEGEFSNIQPLRFRCSVDQASGRIGVCAWMFAASNEEIDPLTGRIRVSQRGFWRCRTPLARGTTIEQFIDALQGERPLYAPLPHTSTTIMDELIDCL
jgi:hypothetical protein